MTIDQAQRQAERRRVAWVRDTRKRVRRAMRMNREQRRLYGMRASAFLSLALAIVLAAGTADARGWGSGGGGFHQHHRSLSYHERREGR